MPRFQAQHLQSYIQMIQKYSSFILVVFLFFTVQSGAQMFSDESLISDTYRRSFNWQSQCNQQQINSWFEQTQSSIGEFIDLIASNGFARMHKINPNFTKILTANLTMFSNIPILCDSFTNNQGELAHVAYGKMEIGAVLSRYIGLSNLPVDFDEVRSEKVFDDFPQAKHTDRYMLRESLRRTVFHEILHLAKADNNWFWNHNSAKYRDNDVVVACAEFAFPMPLENWLSACEVCSRAIWRESRLNVISQNPNTIMNAKAQCMNLRSNFLTYTEKAWLKP